MNIQQISTTDIQGGAAKAAYRLAKGLRRIGTDCGMLVKIKSADDTYVNELQAARNPQVHYRGLPTFIQENYVNRQRTELSNTLFSLSYSGYDISRHNSVKDADIINLHWIVNFQSPRTIARLASLGKPIVWTLHDQWPFTGGCHYSAGCTKYRGDCTCCPQLREDPTGFIEALQKNKAHFFAETPITVVTPSLWLADCARSSTVFRNHRVVTIPNSLDTSVFKPGEKKFARRTLGLPEDGVILLFGSENGDEKRKGFKSLLSAIGTCLESETFAALARNRHVSVICFGKPARELQTSGLHVTPLGFLETDEQMCAAYNAADIFVLPTLEDNLPNTMLESMSCGTPVIAFATGGVPDVIVQEHNGLLVPPGDSVALGSAIVSLTMNSTKRNVMSNNCRNLAVERFSLEVQARNYQALYQDLLACPAQPKKFTVEAGDRSGIVRVDYQPGPFVLQRYYRTLYRSFLLALGESDNNKMEFIHRVARALRGAIEELLGRRGHTVSAVARLLMASILTIVTLLRNLNNRLKRRDTHE